ncbi:MAG: tRNA (N6-isopentenyl adenosine(37)-C2)-methylthiotransferase MiaB [Bacteroidales bacterium]|jgi:tRNA-2-methylthio-N6-dimethylallyladenosine synthase|nr:tRNA (N6-isopentenyl adenosine(37)-C2)-methylthiotransferase MiaB [Bacteroidales bacterium]
MNRTFFIETYGCQMNFSDSEIVHSVLISAGYAPIEHYKEADIILMNTCSIRDHAEQRVLNRLQEFGFLKKKKPHLKIGILGCMAERLKEELMQLQQSVDLVVGPDAYRDLPSLLNTVESGEKAVNVLLSEEETYAEIEPVRVGDNQVSAFIAIMRGCENFCAYCVVPYTRGKERSRDYETIVSEAQKLFEQGYREITLLGQNVNSYHYNDVNFAQLLARVADVNPLLRVRFATSHPKDLSDELLQTMSQYPNICKAIHLPIQSGSDAVLKKMKRKYDTAWYLDRISAIRRYLPDCSISTDIIAGFCSETEDDHQNTLNLMETVGYASAFMFKYSERPDTFAAKNYPDDVPDDVKSRRLTEIINKQQELSLKSNQADIGKTFEVLVEGVSKKSDKRYFGRNSQNKVVVFNRTNEKIGDYVQIQITDCSAITLMGKSLSNWRNY